MKKTLAILLGLCVVVSLAACGDKKDEDVVLNEEGDVVEDIIEDGLVVEESNYKKTSLTIEDLDEIDSTLFPLGYNYQVYAFENEELTQKDSGEYTYPEDIDHSLLLPIYATMANREILSSSIEDGMIYTVVEISSQDETSHSVLLINDPNSLEYFAASISTENETTLYQFVY